MNKKIITIITVTLLILGLTAFLFVYKNSQGDSGLDILRNNTPFGTSSNNTSNKVPNTQKNNNDLSSENNKETTPKLFQIHKKPVAGAYLFTRQTNDGKDKIIARYMERGIGHIFETELPFVKETRISNTTRLKIYEAIWGNEGKSVAIRYLDDSDNETIRSFLIQLSNEAPIKNIPGEVVQKQPGIEKEGVFLPENISSLVVSSDAKKIFYLINAGSSAIGTIYNIETYKTLPVFSSAITEWVPQWVNSKTISLTTKPSGSVNGFMYSLDINTGKQSKVLWGIPGLTTLTKPDNTKVLYSESSGGDITLSLYDKKTRSSKVLPIKTLSEKCIWGEVSDLYCAAPSIVQPATYPDSWYQGFLSFSDKIWKINTDTFTKTLIVDPVDYAREDIDAINLELSPNSKYLLLTNKKDLSLWGVNLIN